MQDIVERIDRAKALIAPALEPKGDPRPPEQAEADAAELLMIGIDAIGEVIANSRRIAVALEAIAGRQNDGR